MNVLLATTLGAGPGKVAKQLPFERGLQKGFELSGVSVVRQPVTLSPPKRGGAER